MLITDFNRTKTGEEDDITIESFPPIGVHGEVAPKVSENEVVQESLACCFEESIEVDIGR